MPYQNDNGRTYLADDEGERTLLANFVAAIIHETRYDDGNTSQTTLTIQGTLFDGVALPPIVIRAEDFAGMSWVMPRWGVAALVAPGNGIKEHLRAAIQLGSKPTVETVYKHTGWTKPGKDGKRAYLHAGGGITAEGLDSSLRVSLPPELSRYDLPAPPEDPRQAIRAVLQLTGVAPPSITWPLLAATLAPIYGPVDYAIHLTGRTGSFKSELMSLFQSFYGPKMDARHLPGSWSSTANALEAQAHHCKNAAFCVDDFVPSGSAWQVRSYQATAEKLIRAQGNQAGRARLTDTSNLQATMFPRGVILSTGEDTPDGHSIRARMMILETTPGDIKPANLTKAQAARPRYSEATSRLIQDVADNPIDLSGIAEQYRNQYLDVGHTRTPAMLGAMLSVIDQFIAWANKSKVLNGQQANNMMSEAHAAILETAKKQAEYLHTADPCEIFCTVLRTMLATGLAHVRTPNGGIPNRPEELGWVQQQGLGEIATYQSKGPCIGWINWRSDELYLEVNAGIPLVRKHVGSEVSLTKNTMLKRLKDAGMLTRVDDARQRNQVRITAEKHPRTVVSLRASDVMENEDDSGPPAKIEDEIARGDAFEPDPTADEVE